MDLPLIASEQRTDQGKGKSPQHICVVTETYPPEINGVAITLSNLAEGLAGRGNTVSLVRPRQRLHDGARGTTDSLTLVRGLPLPGYRGLQFGLPCARVLRRSWARNRPDVVYIATEGPLGWSAGRVAKEMGITAFSGFHTNYHIYSRHYRLRHFEGFVFRYLRRFHNQTSGTLVPSIELRDRLQSFGFKNVTFLARGVDSQRFGPERRSDELRQIWGMAEEDLAVLYVGRIAPEKNLMVAIDAYRAMKRSNESVKFVIVGDGPLRAALERDNPDLIFRGMQTGEHLARHYASADVFLFPSETETFGNVTLEAMASGLVVVAYDYAAAKLHVSHGETGLLIPFGDSRAFVESAAKLARESSTIERIRMQAREYAASINWPRVVERFEKVLTSSLPGEGDTSNPLMIQRGMASS